jgi:hypothetical protein
MTGVIVTIVKTLRAVGDMLFRCVLEAAMDSWMTFSRARGSGTSVPRVAHMVPAALAPVSPGLANIADTVRQRVLHLEVDREPVVLQALDDVAGPQRAGPVECDAVEVGDQLPQLADEAGLGNFRDPKDLERGHVHR